MSHQKKSITALLSTFITQSIMVLVMGKGVKWDGKNLYVAGTY